MVAPHRQRQGVADLLEQRGHALSRQLHGIEPCQ
jgi:hypothetical protein